MRQNSFILFSLILLVYLSPLLIMPYIGNVDVETYVYTSRISYDVLGTPSQSLNTDFFTFNIFLNTSWQTSYLASVDGAYQLGKDLDGNPILSLNLSTPFPGQNVV